jgi:predicted transport protein
MAKTQQEMVTSMIENLEAKTGKSLADWIKVARQTGQTKHGEIVKLLKAQYGLTHGYANFVALRSLEPADAPAPEGDALVDAQYSGARAPLRTLYEDLLTSIRKFGPDVEIAPKKGYVSLRRNKQFALIQPSTASRLDVGINLKGVSPKGRLEPSGSFNAMVSHRVRLSDKTDIDAELLGWLRKAYEGA